MSVLTNSLIPEEKRALVSSALRAAFGTDEIEDIRVLAGGLSTARVYRIVVRGVAYLLRIIMRSDAMGDPSRQYAAMRVAAEIGIAPRIRHAGIEDRVLIADFISVTPFPSDMAARMARAVRRLHALPAFPAPQMGNYLDIMNGIVQRFRAAKHLPDGESEEMFRQYERVLSVYPRTEADMVSSHNDLKPENLVFDGERVWFVDWEAAFLNDRYVDLAVPYNFFVENEAGEAAYLAEYFGEPAGEYRTARFYLMRQLLHVFYGAFLLSLAVSAGLAVQPEIPAEDFREFHRRMLTEGLLASTPEVKLRYAKVHLAQFVRNMRTARFEESLAKVAEASR